MRRNSLVKLLKIVIALCVTLVVLPANELCAERVGYSFSGTLTGTTSIPNLFNYTVPRPSPVTGTFSYDTTAPCVDCDPSDGVRTYHQLIEGGYTLDINNGQVQLAASDYTITVANDFGTNQNDTFAIDYNYDSAANPPITPAPILEHSTPWSGPTKTRAFIKLQFSWSGPTFTDADEPKLTADRPLTANPAYTAFVGSSPAPRFFTPSSISAIVPTAGDYNYDGKLDNSDYIEWRKAFGESEPQFLFADGNNDGAVDAADYIVWQKAMSAGTAATFWGANNIPEPAGLLLVGVAGACLGIGGRRVRCRAGFVGKGRP